MAEDWDLSAVVRSCTAPADKHSPCLDHCFGLQEEFEEEEEQDEEEEEAILFSSSRAVGISFSSNELQDSYKPFLFPSTKDSTKQEGEPVGAVSGDHDFVKHGASTRPSTASSVFQKLLESPDFFRTPCRVFTGLQSPEVSVPAATAQPQPSLRSRKRKNQQKRTVCHVTAENLSSDMWAWRKYGQKPIKGSPYPRNYYRCSSSKGCSARKQVERSNLDPKIFIVTYTGEHIHPRPTHRNSLAGSTRSKHSTNPRLDSNAPTLKHDSTTSTVVTRNGGNEAPSSSPPPPNLSPATPRKETENESIESPNVDDEMYGVDEGLEDEDDELLIPNLALRDREVDLFSGVGGLISSGGGG